MPLQVAAAFAGTVHGAHELVPQLLTLELLEQVPEQLWYPALQAIPHAPAVHVAAPFAGAEHAVVQLPQCVVSTVMFTSHPSDASALQSR